MGLLDGLSLPSLESISLPGFTQAPSSYGGNVQATTGAFFTRGAVPSEPQNYMQGAQDLVAPIGTQNIGLIALTIGGAALAAVLILRKK